MSKGILVFAFNNEQINYIKQAEFLAKRAMQYCNLKTTLVTDIPLKSDVFENIILFDKKLAHTNKTYRDGDNSVKLQFKNVARIYAYNISPYDETIVLDSDIIICNDHYNKVFDQADDLLMYSDAYDITDERDKNEFKYVSDIGCRFYWATCIYFRKTNRTQMFFNLVQHVYENYHYYKTLYELPTRVYRNDYAFSIAVHIMNNFVNTPIGKFPGTLYYSTDRDFILHIDKQDILFLSEKNKPIKTKSQNIHAMNKFNLEQLL